MASSHTPKLLGSLNSIWVSCSLQQGTIPHVAFSLQHLNSTVFPGVTPEVKVLHVSSSTGQPSVHVLPSSNQAGLHAYDTATHPVAALLSRLRALKLHTVPPWSHKRGLSTIARQSAHRTGIPSSSVLSHSTLGPEQQPAAQTEATSALSKTSTSGLTTFVPSQQQSAGNHLKAKEKQPHHKAPVCEATPHSPTDTALQHGKQVRRPVTVELPHQRSLHAAERQPLRPVARPPPSGPLHAASADKQSTSAESAEGAKTAAVQHPGKKGLRPVSVGLPHQRSLQATQRQPVHPVTRSPPSAPISAVSADKPSTSAEFEGGSQVAAKIKAVSVPKNSAPNVRKALEHARAGVPEVATSCLPQYEELKTQQELRSQSSSHAYKLDVAGRYQLTNLLQAFAKSARVVEKAKEAYISVEVALNWSRSGAPVRVRYSCPVMGANKENLYPISGPPHKKRLHNKTIRLFTQFMDKGATELLRHWLVGKSRYDAEVETVLFGYYKSFLEDHYADDIQRFKSDVTSLDLRQPHTWYPFARALKRKFIYHMGPTNSGKTYSAIQALKMAEKGLYCGPLRLLALEVYDALNNEGVLCSLLTGEEQRIVPGAQHVACTVEMAPTKQRWDVAVVDEIQMIGDQQRGSAWTRALLALPASEIHLCGDGSAKALVQKICKEMGETCEFEEYQRFSQLQVVAPPSRGLSDVQKGDCVVAFGKVSIFQIKQEIEQRTGHKVCVVYGGLPPETRRAQARLFNDPDSGYDVLVASDAIGMGLNLNIRRIVFSSMSKADKTKKQVALTDSHIKQIAGRAGRRNSQYPVGLVTCLHPSDMPRLRSALAAPPEMLLTPRAGLSPELEQIEMLAANMPTATYKQVLYKFASEARLDGPYFFANLFDQLMVAEALQEVQDLSLADRYKFCMAPVRVDNMIIRDWLVHFARGYAAGATVHPPRFDLNILEKERRNMFERLNLLEAYHQITTLWLWLSYRFENKYFPGRSLAMEQYEDICSVLDDCLSRMTGVKLPKLGGAHARSPSQSRSRAQQIKRHSNPALNPPGPSGASGAPAGSLSSGHRPWRQPDLGRSAAKPGVAAMQPTSRLVPVPPVRTPGKVAAAAEGK